MTIPFIAQRCIIVDPETGVPVEVAADQSLHVTVIGMPASTAVTATMVGPTATTRLPSAAATTNLTPIKASAGRLFTITGYNAAAALRYLKLYNVVSGSVTVGTTVPVLSLALPPMSGFAFDFPGHTFDTAMSFALTTGAADNDTGALAAGDILGLNILTT